MNQNIAKVILPLAALSCAQGRMLAQDTARPNILYIMCDDHAMQAISAYFEVSTNPEHRPFGKARYALPQLLC